MGTRGGFRLSRNEPRDNQEDELETYMDTDEIPDPDLAFGLQYWKEQPASNDGVLGQL